MGRLEIFSKTSNFPKKFFQKNFNFYEN